MTIHENLERVVNANPWRAVAFLLIAAIGLASAGGVYVGAAERRFEDFGQRIEKLEDRNKKVDDMAESISAMDARQALILDQLRRMEKKLDSR